MQASPLITLVGAGPGDPDLMTRGAWKAIDQAQVIVYDALVSDAIRAEFPRSARLIYVGKLKGRHSLSQDEIGNILVRLGRKGLKVVRLKGGDPLVFGRLGEELDALNAAGLNCQVIPGITAASGCAAAAGICLTERGRAQRLRMVTAHGAQGEDIDWSALARTDETLVFYMGLSMAGRISQELIRAGLAADWPVLLAHKGTQPDQAFVRTTLAQLPDAATHIGSPTLIYVGRVVERYCEDAHWQIRAAG